MATRIFSDGINSERNLMTSLYNKDLILTDGLDESKFRIIGERIPVINTKIPYVKGIEGKDPLLGHPWTSEQVKEFCSYVLNYSTKEIGKEKGGEEMNTIAKTIKQVVKTPVKRELQAKLKETEIKYNEVNATYRPEDKDFMTRRFEKLCKLGKEINTIKNQIKLVDVLSKAGIEKLHFTRGVSYSQLSDEERVRLIALNQKRSKDGKLPKQLPKDTTVMVSQDDKRSVVMREYSDEYDKEKAFLMAYFQLHSGLNKTEVSYLMDQIGHEDMNFVKTVDIKVNKLK